MSICRTLVSAWRIPSLQARRLISPAVRSHHLSYGSAPGRFFSGSSDTPLPTVGDVTRAKETLENQGAAPASGKPNVVNYDENHRFTKLYMQGLEYAQRKRHREAIAAYRQAIEIATSDGGPDCLEVATVNIDMARAYAQMANPAVALKLASTGMPTYAKYWGTESKVYGEAAYETAMYYAMLRKPTEALELLYACRSSFMKHFGANHPKTMQLFSAIAMLKTKSP